MFDGLRKLTKDLTGKALLLRHLSKEGTLLTIGVDMEVAQALAAGDSFLPTNEPEYSGIHTTDSSELIQYFVRTCHAHVKRYVSRASAHPATHFVGMIFSVEFINSGPMLPTTCTSGLSGFRTSNQKRSLLNSRSSLCA